MSGPLFVTGISLRPHLPGRLCGPALERMGKGADLLVAEQERTFAAGKPFAAARDWRTEMALEPSRQRPNSVNSHAKSPAKMRLRAQGWKDSNLQPDHYERLARWGRAMWRPYARRNCADWVGSSAPGSPFGRSAGPESTNWVKRTMG